jgi:hypothetical protein
MLHRDIFSELKEGMSLRVRIWNIFNYRDSLMGRHCFSREMCTWGVDLGNYTMVGNSVTTASALQTTSIMLASRVAYPGIWGPENMVLVNAHPPNLFGTRKGALIALQVLFLSISLLVFSLRIYTIAKILRSSDSDDILMGVAMVRCVNVKVWNLDWVCFAFSFLASLCQSTLVSARNMEMGHTNTKSHPPIGQPYSSEFGFQS